MNLKIGAIIKKMRIENNVTQDGLAMAIGVTPQAVSRWEAENGYPDIELLPAIADFFAVSTDELLGYKRSEREERLSEIKKEMARLSEVGTIGERIGFARTAASQYPSDWEIKNQLAVCLYHFWCDRHEDSVLSEIENLCQSIIDNCKNEDVGTQLIMRNLIKQITKSTIHRPLSINWSIRRWDRNYSPS